MPYAITDERRRQSHPVAAARQDEAIASPRDHTPPGGGHFLPLNTSRPYVTPFALHVQQNEFPVDLYDQGK